MTSYRDVLALLIDFLGRGSRHAVALDDIDALSVGAFLDHPESQQGQRHLDEEPEAGRPELVLLPRARQEARFLLQDCARDGSAAQTLYSPGDGIPHRSRGRGAVLQHRRFDQTRAEGEGHDRLPLRGGGVRWGAHEFSLLSVEARRRTYVEPHGKGGKTRNVPITRGYEKLIGAYASAFGIGRGEQVLFANRYGQPLTSKGVSYVLEKDLRAAAERMPGIGKERITCHSLRHSREMHLLEVGVNPIYIRDMLGHSSVTTAEMYAKTDPEVKCRLLEEHGANYLVASRYTRSERDGLAQ